MTSRHKNENCDNKGNSQESNKEQENTALREMVVRKVNSSKQIKVLRSVKRLKMNQL